jgi:hypothetical protein
MVQPRYHIFVCTSCRINGVQKGFCYSKNSADIVRKFIEEVETGIYPVRFSLPIPDVLVFATKDLLRLYIRRNLVWKSERGRC